MNTSSSVCCIPQNVKSSSRSEQCADVKRESLKKASAMYSLNNAKSLRGGRGGDCNHKSKYLLLFTNPLSPSHLDQVHLWQNHEMIRKTIFQNIVFVFPSVEYNFSNSTQDNFQIPHSFFTERQQSESHSRWQNSIFLLKCSVCY